MPAISRWWKPQHTRLKRHISVEHTLSHTFVDFNVSASYLGQGGYFKIVWRIPGTAGCAHTWHGHFCAAVLEGSRNPGQWWLRLHMRNYTMSEWIFVCEWVWEGCGETDILMCQLPAFPRYRLPSMWRKLLVEIFTNPFRVSRLCNFVDLDDSAFYLGSRFM